MDVREANSSEFWDRLWKKEQAQPWRTHKLGRLYERVVDVVKRNRTPPVQCIDVGGGIGDLAQALAEEGYTCTVLDHSLEALRVAAERGLGAQPIDLEGDFQLPIPEGGVVVCTEVLEHLTQRSLLRFLNQVKESKCLALMSVPNDCMGPEEEPQHAHRFTALEYLTLLREVWGKQAHVRVECVDAVDTPNSYLLGVCGTFKPFTMSVCFPARNEARDIEKTLKSFRGVADEMVIGIDPRSTDDTESICRRYAEKVFTLESPQGRNPEDRAPEEGVHFADIRNQCIERCTSKWIFMTEAHEYLGTGQDSLLRFENCVPPGTKLGFVLRTGQGQRWAFPWIILNTPEIRYSRKTHNIVSYPEGTPAVKLPGISTVHERSHEAAVARKAQRKVQNRKTLFEDWLKRGNEQSLYYFASELRDFSAEKAIERFEQLLSLPPTFGAMRYQARLVLSQEYIKKGMKEDARRVLLGCIEDDWSRADHWMRLGDLAFDAEQYEEALQWYQYQATMIGKPPWTVWWIDLYVYGYLAAQRLAMCYAALNRGEEALTWARKVLELLPDDSPPEARVECQRNIEQLEKAVGVCANGAHAESSSLSPDENFKETKHEDE